MPLECQNVFDRQRRWSCHARVWSSTCLRSLRESEDCDMPPCWDILIMVYYLTFYPLQSFFKTWSGGQVAKSKICRESSNCSWHSTDRWSAGALSLFSRTLNFCFWFCWTFGNYMWYMIHITYCRYLFYTYHMFNMYCIVRILICLAGWARQKLCSQGLRCKYEWRTVVLEDLLTLLEALDDACKKLLDLQVQNNIQEMWVLEHGVLMCASFGCFLPVSSSCLCVWTAGSTSPSVSRSAQSGSGGRAIEKSFKQLRHQIFIWFFS